MLQKSVEITKELWLKCTHYSRYLHWNTQLKHGSHHPCSLAVNTAGANRAPVFTSHAGEKQSRAVFCSTRPFCSCFNIVILTIFDNNV